MGEELAGGAGAIDSAADAKGAIWPGAVDIAIMDSIESDQVLFEASQTMGLKTGTQIVTTKVTATVQVISLNDEGRISWQRSIWWDGESEGFSRKIGCQP